MVKVIRVLITISNWEIDEKSQTKHTTQMYVERFRFIRFC